MGFWVFGNRNPSTCCAGSLIGGVHFHHPFPLTGESLTFSEHCILLAYHQYRLESRLQTVVKTVSRTNWGFASTRVFYLLLLSLLANKSFTACFVFMIFLRDSARCVVVGYVLANMKPGNLGARSCLWTCVEIDLQKTKRTPPLSLKYRTFSLLTAWARVQGVDHAT